MSRQYQLPWRSFCPFAAKTVTSIMLYTGLLVAVLVLLFIYLSETTGFITKVVLMIYH
jgi:hypothetical protein